MLWKRVVCILGGGGRRKGKDLFLYNCMSWGIAKAVEREGPVLASISPQTADSPCFLSESLNRRRCTLQLTLRKPKRNAQRYPDECVRIARPHCPHCRPASWPRRGSGGDFLGGLGRDLEVPRRASPGLNVARPSSIVFPPGPPALQFTRYPLHTDIGDIGYCILPFLFSIIFHYSIFSSYIGT